MREPTPEEIKEIESRFTYHPPKGDQPARYVAIRESAKDLAHTIIRCCPPSRERATALTELTLVTMLANSAIAINE
jgi:hypothetical protein